MIKKLKNWKIFIIIGPIFVLVIYIIVNLWLMFFPWTKWETFKTLEHGGTDEEIVLSLIYLGNLKNPKYIHYIMDYIDECERIESTNRRNLLVTFPTPIAFFANQQLVKITEMDFNYDITKDCEDPENQAAIQAWKDWYETEYKNFLPLLTTHHVPHPQKPQRKTSLFREF